MRKIGFIVLAVVLLIAAVAYSLMPFTLTTNALKCEL
jgi:hypothetical protein